MQKILVATGLPEFDNSIYKIEGYDFINISIGYKRELFEACVNFKPDILILTERLSGDEMLSEILINLKQKQPNIRIIYLAGEINLSDMNKVSRLGAMVMAGIYDIVVEKKVNKGLVEAVLENPKTYSDVEYLLRYFVNKRKESDTIMEYEEDIEEDYIEDNYYKNVFMISSIKPGTVN